MSERLEEIIASRIKKLQNIKQMGTDPYPSFTVRSHTNSQALENFEQLTKTEISLVGRVRSFRDMGKIVFVHIEDGSAKIQILFKSDDLAENEFKFILKNLDIGDFLQTSGILFKTKTGEKTLQVKSYKLLAKSLLPLPSEHFGLADEETKLRKRYLDILLNPKSKEIFFKKAIFWSAIREFLEKKGFLHIDMPILEPIPGGAEARPFITHHNALDKNFYLRISLELPLKKMLVAGYEKVFEIGRIFRNEGIDTEHLQDYTQMEFYWAYASFEDLMLFCQEMYKYVLEKTFGTLKIESRGQTVDWSGDWEKVSYTKLFKTHTELDLMSVTDDDLKNYCKKNQIAFEDFAGRGRIIDLIFKKIRKHIPAEKPVFLVDQPIELEPLAKRDPNNPKLVQRMQIIAYGTELGKGFGELNDPVDQRARFEDQMKLRESGDEEAQMLDMDYVEAMEYGMPPAAGFGLSERLFAILTDKSIRETVVFPLMKDENKLLPNQPAPKTETKLAVVVLNKEAKLNAWQVLNATAHLSAEFGIHGGKQLLFTENIETKDNRKIMLNAQHAIVIKTAQTNSAVKDLSNLAKKKKIQVYEFTREMLETTNDKKVIEITKNKSFDEIEMLGVMVFGGKKEVDLLTANFELYS